MVSAPINLYTQETANKAAKLRVFLGPSDGSHSDEFEESFDLIPLEIFRIAGSRPDYALFEYKTEKVAAFRDATGTMTEDDAEISFNRQVYIEVFDAQKNNVVDDTGAVTKFSTVLFWGELLTETLNVDPQSQRITIAARVADYHFGSLLEGEKQYDPIDNVFIDVPVDPVFNPLIDGIVEHNMSHPQYQNNSGYPGYSVWVDPEADRSDRARYELLDSVLELSNFDPFGDTTSINNLTVRIAWTLADVVDTLSLMLLGGFAGEFLQQGIAAFPDAPEIENLTVRRGRHLNEVLDAVLIQHGYEWFLDPAPFDPALIAAESGTNGLPAIQFFRRGEGVVKIVHLQPPGEDLDLAQTSADVIAIETDVGNLANEIRGFGSFEQKEITIPLFRAWPDDDDALTTADLMRSDPDSLYHASGTRSLQDAGGGQTWTIPAARTAAWRLWVGNEAGDYSFLRQPGQVKPVTGWLNLSGVFEEHLPLRRQIEDCLTRDENGKRRPPYLEWWDPGALEWKEVPPEWSWVVERDQIAIRFVGDTPPEELMSAGDDALLRITCTITGDARLTATSTPSLDESPSLRTVPLFVDLSDRFHRRSVQTSGPFASVLAGDAHGADERDDSGALQSYLAALLDVEVSAEIRSAFRLHGLSTEYQIGDVIEAIDDRGIYLNRNKHDPNLKANKKFVQIYGIRHLPQEQKTELIVEAVEALLGSAPPFAVQGPPPGGGNVVPGLGGNVVPGLEGNVVP